MLLIMDNKTPALSAERIQKLMDEKGWEVGILAYRANVPANTIYKYLSGARTAGSESIDRIAKLAEALGVSIEYLLGLTDVRTPTAIIRLTDVQQQLVTTIGNLSPRRQKDLAAIIQMFLKMDADERAVIER